MLKKLLIAFLYFVEYVLILLGFLFKPIIFIAQIIENMPRYDVCPPMSRRERYILEFYAVHGFFP